jgi:glycosyltransferase involved in cell wall biosynthesis
VQLTAIQTQFVLITPARNEERFLEQTIRSMLSQTAKPVKWVIVSDGSTDGTDEIVRKYAAENNWIELVHMPDHRDRQFAAKVQCFNAGCQRLKGMAYDVIGSLDADITFGPDYFEFLLARFAADPGLGVAGTPFVEGGSSYDYRFTNIEHVSGACQLFRRKCFEEIGGYIPIRGGGIDWTAVTTARMKGWRTRTFTERVCHHHRPMGTGNSSPTAAWFKHGRKDYYLGGHPVWQTFRACFQMTRRPYFVGGLLLFIGYWWAFLCRVERPVPPELIRFHRNEQLARLKGMLRHAIPFCSRPLAR